MSESLDFLDVSFSYDTLARPLVVGLRASLPRGWTGLVGANGAGKTTVLLLACGLLRPQSGRINRPASVIYCPQRTDEPPPLLGDLLEAGEAAACALRARLRVQADWARRWGSGCRRRGAGATGSSARQRGASPWGRGGCWSSPSWP